MMVIDLEDAIIEAKRFLAAADVLRKAGVCEYSVKEYLPGSNSAAVKRASMYLSKALVRIMG